MGKSGGNVPIAFPTSDEMTVKRWSKDLEREVLPRTLYGTFKAAGIFLEKTDLSRDAGDEVSFSLEALLNGDGKIQNEKLSTPDTANEEGTVFYTDKVGINQLRHAVRWYGRIDQQRVVVDLRRSARDGLSDWWSERIDVGWINQVMGNTALFDADPTDVSADGLHPGLKYSGLNKTIAPSTNNLIDASGQKLNYALIEDMVTKAKTMHDAYGQPIIRPVRISGGEFYPILCHSYSWRDLRRDSEFRSVQQSAMDGGLIGSNPIFTGSAGVYGSAVFFESQWVPGVPKDDGSGDYETDLKRVALMGKGSMCCGYGRGFGDNRYSWDEDRYDLGNENVIGAASIYGEKKTQFGESGSEYDYAVIVADVFASANAASAPS